MRALLDSGSVTKDGSSRSSRPEREQVAGPAMRTLDDVYDPDGAFVAA